MKKKLNNTIKLSNIYLYTNTHTVRDEGVLLIEYIFMFGILTKKAYKI